MTIMTIDFILMLFVTGLINQCNTLPQVIKIAAIFEKELAGSAMEHVFRYTVHKINQDKSILPATTLVHDIQYVSRNDSFHAGKTVCSQLNGGAQAIFGPCDSLLAAHVQSICDALDIPHLEWRLDYDSGGKEFSVNLYPSQTLMNKAMQDLINYLNWTRVAVIYEQNHGKVLSVSFFLFTQIF